VSPTFGSLFAGIGGIDLGLERAGWTGRWQVEWDPFCQHVLAHHWPDVPRYGDITRVDWSTVEPVDLIAGGFPCQPFSVAGKQRGIEDERWLWPEFARAIRELRPRYVLVENVPGLLAGHGGMGHVLADLAALGYDAEWDSVPAAAVGAPHLRYRVWVVAYPHGEGQSGVAVDAGSRRGELVPLADTNDRGRDGWSGQQRPAGRGEPANSRHAMADAHGTGSQGHGRLDHGWNGPRKRIVGEGGWPVSSAWGVEPDVGRVAHGVPARVDRLRALGNAVVPQVVEVLGRRLLDMSAERCVVCDAPESDPYHGPEPCALCPHASSHHQFARAGCAA
jgi:DNA (cytosine-5)-methyltransferase 1